MRSPFFLGARIIDLPTPPVTTQTGDTAAETANSLSHPPVSMNAFTHPVQLQ